MRRIRMDWWMVDLKDVSVDASHSPDLAKLVFEREGILVVKNLLPRHVVQPIADFLRGALQEIDAALRQYGFSLQDADAAAHLTALMEASPAELPERHRHMFLGHFPLEVRLGRAVASHSSLPEHASPAVPAAGDAATVCPHAADGALCPAALLAGARSAAPGHQLQSPYGRLLRGVGTPVAIDRACGGMAAYARTHDAPEAIAEQQSVAADGWLPPIDAALPRARDVSCLRRWSRETW